MGYGKSGKVIREKFTAFSGGFFRKFQMFREVWLEEGGWSEEWMTTRELRAAIARWVKRSYQTKTPELEAWYRNRGYDTLQCGGCRFFAAFDSDYGLCCNRVSPHDGRVVFEHAGCEAHSERQKIIDSDSAAWGRDAR